MPRPRAPVAHDPPDQPDPSYAKDGPPLAKDRHASLEEKRRALERLDEALA
ncbi:hypothetical protein ACWGQ5_14970 [Streptomyces sp. NPDC055722]